MKIYGIYDITNKEQCVRVGTLQEITKYLGMSARMFDRAISSHKYKNYELMYLFEEA